MSSLFGLPSLTALDRSSPTRIWLGSAHIDMRLGFDRLAELAAGVTGQDPLSGHLFLFRSRGGDRLKMLYWDKDGYVLWYKKLETEGTHLVVRTELRRRANNRYIGLAGAGRLGGISRQSGARRSIMPQHGSASVPPPRAPAQPGLPLERLWRQLNPAKRQQALRTLAAVMARQIQPPRGKEADNER